MGEKRTADAVDRKEPWSQRRATEREREAHTGECTRRTIPQSQWLGKQEGQIFMSSCHHQGLKPVVSKVRGPGWDEARKSYLGRRQANNLEADSMETGSEKCLGHTGLPCEAAFWETPLPPRGLRT